MPLTPFNPPEDQLDTVLETLADPDHSLRSAAELLNTSVHALSLFLLQPEISERLSIHNQAAAVKARLNACAALPDTATALRHAVNEYTHESLNAPYQLSNPRAVELRRRSRETMRKAASLLLRLATFDPTKPTRPTDHRSRLRDRYSPAAAATIPSRGGMPVAPHRHVPAPIPNPFSPDELLDPAAPPTDSSPAPQAQPAPLPLRPHPTPAHTNPTPHPTPAHHHSSPANPASPHTPASPRGPPTCTPPRTRPGSS